MALSKGFRLNSATTPLDFRLAQQGGLFRNASASPRQGILHSGSADGNIITRSASALSVTLLDQVVLALTRNTAGTDGVDILTNVGALVQNVNAPTANSWYAVFWARQNDSTGAGGSADPDSLPTFGVTYGAAAASPAIPATPTGATKIGHMLIPSNATTAQFPGVVYTETIPHTCMTGGRIRYRTVAEMTNDVANLADGAVGFVRSGDLYFLKGGVWTALTDDTGWVTLTPTNSAYRANAAEPCQYRVIRGVCYFRGQVDAVSGNVGSVNVTVLPVPVRPLTQRWISAQYFGGATMCRVIIGMDGTMSLNTNGGTSNYFRLDGITYPVS